LFIIDKVILGVVAMIKKVKLGDESEQYTTTKVASNLPYKICY